MKNTQSGVILRNFIKKNFPVFFAAIKHIWWLFNNRTQNSAPHRNEELKLVEQYFQDGIVANGPFKGLKYLRRSYCSALLPKLLGSYEEPIQDWINNVKTDSYSKILCIGCAEGYYAVGLAKSKPETFVIAYDTNSDALSLAKQLSNLNEIDNIDFRGHCDHSELARELDYKCLIFCDIEGAELDLLDKKKCPQLASADIICECHDFILPGTTETLISRFYETHVIQCNVDYPFRIKDYENIRGRADNAILARLSDEIRPTGMKWLRMKSKSNLSNLGDPNFLENAS